MRSKCEAKSVTGKSRENVQVHMKDFLHRGLAVSQKEIDAFASHPTAPNRRRNSLPLLHQPPRRWRVEVGKIRYMAHRDHQHVPRIDRLNIQKRSALLITKEECDRQLAG